jgi:hypothetical protein
MNPKFFQQLLAEMDPTVTAQHSTINHHVEGMDYLCLHRGDKLTAKLYFIEPKRVKAAPGEFLVTPHSHRYAFQTVVMAGDLTHVRFDKVIGHEGNWEHFGYHAETRARRREGFCDLSIRSSRVHSFGNYLCDSYWVDAHELHTLRVPEEPVLLGLVQFGDTREQSDIFIKTEKKGALEFAASRRPSVDEVIELEKRAKFAIHNGELK